MNIAEQIAALRHTRTQKAAAMQAVMTKGFTEKRSTTDEERTDFDGLKADIAALDADLSRLEELERVNKSLALAVPPTPAAPQESKEPMITVKSNAKPLEVGEGFGRWARVVAKSKGNLMDAERIAKAMFPEDYTLGTVIKAAVAAGSTTDATWSKPLVNVQNYAGDFIEFLRPQTILGKFGAGGVPGLRRVPFNVKIVGQTSGATANWVGEGKATPVTKWAYNDVNIGMTKVQALAVLTDELVRSSDPAADLLARDELARAIVEKLDTSFISASAGVAGASPAGILNGVTPIVKSVATDGFAAMQADVQAVFGAYIAARMAPKEGVWIMSSATALKLAMMRNPLGQAENAGMTMSGGNFAGLPVIVSDHQSTAGQIILVNASDIYLADDGSIQLDMSSEASIEMNDAPTQNSLAGTGAAMVSMFQTNSVAIRAGRYTGWAKRRAAAVQTVTNTLWA